MIHSVLESVMNSNGIQSINRLPRLFFKLFTWGIMGFVCAQTAYAVPVDIKSYDPARGAVVKIAGKTLVMGWDTPEGSTELSLIHI